MNPGRELDALIEQAIFGHPTELRWCRLDPGSGEWNEVQSVYEDDEVKRDVESDPSWHSKQPCYDGYPHKDIDPDWVVWCVVPDYSTDIAAAWAVVSRMESLGYWCEIRTPFGTDDLNDGYWAGFTPHGTSGWNGTPDYWTSASTAPHAICLAVKAWWEEKRHEQPH